MEVRIKTENGLFGSDSLKDLKMRCERHLASLGLGYKIRKERDSLICDVPFAEDDIKALEKEFRGKTGGENYVRGDTHTPCDKEVLGLIPRMIAARPFEPFLFDNIALDYEDLGDSVSAAKYSKLAVELLPNRSDFFYRYVMLICFHLEAVPVDAMEFGKYVVSKCSRNDPLVMLSMAILSDYGLKNEQLTERYVLEAVERGWDPAADWFDPCDLGNQLSEFLITIYLRHKERGETEDAKKIADIYKEIDVNGDEIEDCID